MFHEVHEGSSLHLGREGADAPRALAVEVPGLRPQEAKERAGQGGGSLTMTTMKTVDEVWTEAESLFQGVHLHRVRPGYYVAQVNRQGCVCERCSCERSGSTPVEALACAIADLSMQPVHVSQELRQEKP